MFGKKYSTGITGGSESRVISYRIEKWMRSNMSKVIIISIFVGILIQICMYYMWGWIVLHQFRLFCMGN